MTDYSKQEAAFKHDDVPVSYSASVSDIFVDGVQGLQFINGVTKIGLYSMYLDLEATRVDGAASAKKVIFAHLAMSTETLLQFRDWLNKLDLPDVATKTGE